MTQIVDRDEELTLNAGNFVAYTVDFGASAPSAPADPTAEPSASWVPCGAIDENGLTEGFKMTTQKIMAIGIMTPFRMLYTEQDKTFQMTLLEMERDICQSLAFRTGLSSMTRAGGLRSVSESGTLVPDQRAWLFRAIDGANIQQIYAPIAEITDIADVKYDQKGVASLQCTLNCFPDANGIVAYRLDNFPVTPAASNS
jgi:hypothetical protein